MTQLIKEKCIACRSDSSHVTQQEIAELHPQIADWSLIVEEEIPKLERRFRFKNFVEALAFTNKIGDLAESEGHHPRIVTEWGRVNVTWWTHKIKNLHRNDFIMAAKTDQIYQGLLETSP